MCASPGFSASWPETKTSPPARIACEYGAPWNGAGAASVRTTDFSVIWSSAPLLARLRERDAERLEDRLEHVLGVGAVEQANVQVEARALGEALEKPVEHRQTCLDARGAAAVQLHPDASAAGRLLAPAHRRQRLTGGLTTSKDGPIGRCLSPTRRVACRGGMRFVRARLTAGT